PRSTRFPDRTLFRSVQETVIEARTGARPCRAQQKRAPPTKLLLALAVTGLEARHPTTGVEDLLLTRVEGVAVRADLDVDGVGRSGAASGEGVTATADHRGDVVVGMNTALHGVLSSWPPGPRDQRGEPEPDVSESSVPEEPNAPPCALVPARSVLVRTRHVLGDLHQELGVGLRLPQPVQQQVDGLLRVQSV